MPQWMPNIETGVEEANEIFSRQEKRRKLSPEKKVKGEWKKCNSQWNRTNVSFSDKLSRLSYTNKLPYISQGRAMEDLNKEPSR
jgi:hypothetical protein